MSTATMRSTTAVTGTAKERFAVSAKGLRQLNADRDPWSLVKELIQNAWDEAPAATLCEVTIDRAGPDRTTVSVEDDGGGFADISDAWTLMADTPKRSDPTKRGRFNLGEKEIVAVAISATIETAGTTVLFPADGGRKTEPNRRKRGTKVTVLMPWTAAQIEELKLKLSRFRPTDCRLVVNGEEIPRRDPIGTRETTLRTVIQHGPGQPVTETRRKTRIDVLERADEETGWICEMGIPIQPIAMPYDIDVHQKVPMPPNRNTVSPGYLQDVMAETLNAMHSKMSEDSFAENWVRTAVEDKRIEDDAVVAVRTNRYGEKAVIWSSDTDSNLRAAEAGYQVINPRAMSHREREVMSSKGGLQSAKREFGRAPETAKPVNANNVRDRFTKWVVQIGNILGMQPTVTYVEAPGATFVAQCAPSRTKPDLMVNTSYCPDPWLAKRGYEQLDLIIHELAHALADSPMEHGPRWGEACALAGAKVADAIARKKLRYDPGAGPSLPEMPVREPMTRCRDLQKTG